MISALVFPTVPSKLITSVSLSPSNPTETVGSSVTLTCEAVLTVDVSGAIIEFDYNGLTDSSVAAVSGTFQTNMATISLVTISSASEYTCTVTVTASGVCGGSEPACPTNTSDAVTLTVRCK